MFAKIIPGSGLTKGEQELGAIVSQLVQDAENLHQIVVNWVKEEQVVQFSDFDKFQGQRRDGVCLAFISKDTPIAFATFKSADFFVYDALDDEEPTLAQAVVPLSDKAGFAINHDFFQLRADLFDFDSLEGNEEPLVEAEFLLPLIRPYVESTLTMVSISQTLITNLGAKKPNVPAFLIDMINLGSADANDTENPFWIEKAVILRSSLSNFLGLVTEIGGGRAVKHRGN